jgi:hypothetical protein
MKKVLIAILVLVLIYASGATGYILKQPAVTPVAAEVPDPEVKQGQYTIFQYTKTGWTNRLYVTEYFIKDKMIFYKPREHQEEYLEMPFEDCLLVPEWIEENEDLMNYGFWEYPEEEYTEGGF